MSTSDSLGPSWTLAALLAILLLYVVAPGAFLRLGLLLYLNPTEHVWSHVKRNLGNLIVHGIDQLTAIVKNRLKRIQYRPDLVDAFFAHTGLNLEPQPS